MLTFEFTPQMAQQIGEILENGPYRIVAPILSEMQRQITAQQSQPQPAQPAGNGQGSKPE